MHMCRGKTWEDPGVNYSAIPPLAPYSQGPHMGIKYSICINYTQWTDGIGQLVAPKKLSKIVRAVMPALRRQRNED